jgi:transcriptional regulator with XRE-family HTH domain
MEDVNPATLGAFIREKRTAAFLSQSTLAAKTERIAEAKAKREPGTYPRNGITQSTISNIERDEVRPEASTLFFLAEALELSEGDRARLRELARRSVGTPPRAPASGAQTAQPGPTGKTPAGATSATATQMDDRAGGEVIAPAGDPAPTLREEQQASGDLRVSAKPLPGRAKRTTPMHLMLGGVALVVLVGGLIGAGIAATEYVRGAVLGPPTASVTGGIGGGPIGGTSPATASPSTTRRAAAGTTLTAPPIRPGGLWVSPADGVQVDVTNGAILFVVFAYPTGPRDPAIARVEITVRWPQTGYTVACVAHEPVQAVEIPVAQGFSNIPPVDPRHSATTSGDIVKIATNQRSMYTCAWAPSDDRSWPDLSQAFSEPVRVTFNVYDAAGNYNLAPHGGRTIHITYRSR